MFNTANLRCLKIFKPSSFPLNVSKHLSEFRKNLVPSFIAGSNSNHNGLKNYCLFGSNEKDAYGNPEADACFLNLKEIIKDQSGFNVANIGRGERIEKMALMESLKPTQPFIIHQDLTDVELPSHLKRGREYCVSSSSIVEQVSNRANALILAPYESLEMSRAIVEKADEQDSQCVFFASTQKMSEIGGLSDTSAGVVLAVPGVPISAQLNFFKATYGSPSLKSLKEMEMRLITQESDYFPEVSSTKCYTSANDYAKNIALFLKKHKGVDEIIGWGPGVGPLIKQLQHHFVKDGTDYIFLPPENGGHPLHVLGPNFKAKKHEIIRDLQGNIDLQNLEGTLKNCKSENKLLLFGEAIEGRHMDCTDHIITLGKKYNCTIIWDASYSAFYNDQKVFPEEVITCTGFHKMSALPDPADPMIAVACVSRSKIDYDYNSTLFNFGQIGEVTVRSLESVSNVVNHWSDNVAVIQDATALANDFHKQFDHDGISTVGSDSEAVTSQINITFSLETNVEKLNRDLLDRGIKCALIPQKLGLVARLSAFPAARNGRESIDVEHISKVLKEIRKKYS